MLKKFLYSSVVLVGFAFYVIYQNRLISSTTEQQQSQSLNRQTNSESLNANRSITGVKQDSRNATEAFPNSSVTQQESPAPSNQTKESPPQTKQPVEQYKDGMYIGSVADAYYGNIQVKAIIVSGKLVDVIFLQYPNDRANSVRVNTEAMPYLREEAIAAQSANVDIVTGATESSRAFRDSLGSALKQAKL